MTWTNLIDLVRQVKNKLPMANGGVPTGGTTGQVLTKVSNTDNDVDWETVTGGGGSGTVTHTGGALTAHRVVVGNGTDDVEVIAAIGSAGQYLRSGGAGADPAFASIAESEITNLATDLAAKVVGPGSATDSDFVQFDGTTGKLVKDGGLALDTTTSLAANSDLKVPSQKAVKAYVDSFAPGGGSSLILKVNSVSNGSQSLLNLEDGNGIKVVDLGAGAVQIKENPITFWAPNGTVAGNTTVTASNVVRIAHFFLPVTVSFTTIGVQNVTADGTNKYSFGIFSLDGATRYAHTTEQVMTGTGTFRALAVAEGTVVLPPGDYLFAWTGAATTASFLTLSAGACTRLAPSSSTTTTALGVMPAAPINVPALSPNQAATGIVSFMLYT